MALPEAVETVLLTFGPFMDLEGATLDGKVTVVPVTPAPLLHVPSGTPLVRRPIVVAFRGSEGGTCSTRLVATNATGLNVTGFAYEVTVTFDSALAENREPKLIQLPKATPTVDFDLMAPVETAEGIIVAQPTVVSVNGQSGAVVLDLDDEDVVTSVNGQVGDVVLALGDLDGDGYATVTDLAQKADAAGADHDVRFGPPQHEDGALFTYGQPLLDFGPVNPPPPARPAPHKGIDIIGYWYNDFGLTYSTTSPSQYPGWYDWRWNFPSNATDGDAGTFYDPARHPLQGFYKGDDADVLGWQCKWLAEAGVNVVSLTTSFGFSNAGWDQPTSDYYWIHQLFNNVPNFRSLKWILWMGEGNNSFVTPTVQRSMVDQIIQTYQNYPGGYTYTEDGKTYAVVHIWDLELLRGTFDNFNGSANTIAFLKETGGKFKAAGLGLDGVMILARNGGTFATPAGGPNFPDITAAGTLIVNSEYAGWSGGTYEQYATSHPLATGSGVLNVMTSATTQLPHPSGMYLPGHTPELFGLLLTRAVDHIGRHGMKRMVTVYNVAEWAEGGPGLIPNKQDGFGYLDAVRAVPALPAPGAALMSDAAQASSNAALTVTGPIDVPGLTKTLLSRGPDSAWTVDVTLDVECFANNGSILIGELRVDNGAVAQQLIMNFSGARLPMSKGWLVNGLAAGSHVLKVSLRQVSGPGNWTAYATHSAMRVVQIA